MQKSGRTAAQIDGNIEYFPVQAAHQLGFGVRRVLKVQAAHGPLVPGQRVVDLRNGLVQTRLAKFIGAVKARQKTALIFNGLALHQRQPGQRGWNEIEASHA